MRLQSILFLFLNSIYYLGISAASHSVLQEGKWYKIGVTKSGIYKINIHFLQSIGIDLENINPHTIKIYGNGGGMLPQKNNSPRIDDLQENPIFIFGEEDNHFDENDYILFYAKGPDAILYNENEKLFFHQKNIYSDISYYFLQISSTNGKRIREQKIISPASSTISSYTDFIFHEEDKYNILKSGREWLGELFDVQLNYSFQLEIPDILNTEPIQIISSVVASSYSPSIFIIKLNGESIGNQPIGPISDDAFAIQAQENKTNFNFQTEPTNALTIEYLYNKQGNSRARGYLNYFSINVKRKLKLSTSSLILRYPSKKKEITTFEVDENDPSFMIWDVSDIGSIEKIPFSLINEKSQFSIETKESMNEFILFKGNEFPAPTFIKEIPNQDLHAFETPELLIITNENLKSEAERLAAFRKQNDEIESTVITVNEIYNEFSSGSQDLTAIRDFIKFLYTKNNQLKYVLLFGDCSYDYKNRISSNTNIVPTYQSRESFHPIYSYASDDYIGFLDENEGDWPEVPPQNHTLEVGIGRIPINSPKEAKQLIDKLIYYSTNKNTVGRWKNKITFIADDGDEATHMKDAENISNQLDTLYSSFEIKKIYLDAYPQITQPDQQIAPSVNKAIDEMIDQGSFIVNYTGHGSEYGWASEKILTIPQIKAWKNKDKLPLVITATCEFGKFDDPQLTSAGETMLLHPTGGSIALITTTRPVFSSSNYLLNNNLYKEIVKNKRLGDSMREAKNKSLSGVINRNFSLLGDPSLRLTIPSYSLAITTINHQPINEKDTLHALEKIILEGIILDENNSFLSTYNGTISLSMWDKSTNEKSLGNESEPFLIKNREKIYQGSGSIYEGKFTCTLIIPKNITYTYGKGKITLYASDENKKEGIGSNITFMIGGSSLSSIEDTDPPQLTLFLNDTLFISGNTVEENPTLIVKLTDESGINLSTKLDHEIKLNLIEKNKQQQEEKIDITNYYEADISDYKKGKIIFPIKKEQEGNYTLSVKAWDIQNNMKQETIEFIISSIPLEIRELVAYPNPFSENTSFDLKTNKEEELQINLSFFSTEGKLIKSITKDINLNEEDYSITWDGTDEIGSKIKPGVYFYTMIIFSKKYPFKKQIRSNRILFLQ